MKSRIHPKYKTKQRATYRAVYDGALLRRSKPHALHAKPRDVEPVLAC